VCGHHAVHEALERELAEWLGAPRALLFGSGLPGQPRGGAGAARRRTICVQDRLNHASLIDAARLAGCRCAAIRTAIRGAMTPAAHVPDGIAMLVTDGVFSMDGDVAPLRELALVARVQTRDCCTSTMRTASACWSGRARQRRRRGRWARRSAAAAGDARQGAGGLRRGGAGR
jgi:hypothetical protein